MEVALNTSFIYVKDEKVGAKEMCFTNQSFQGMLLTVSCYARLPNCQYLRLSMGTEVHPPQPPPACKGHVLNNICLFCLPDAPQV